MPAEGDPPFRVLLEPCWANTTQGFETVAKDAERCPDVPVEYFRENAQEVLTNDGASDDNIGFVSGLPVELNILSIGKNYAFDPNNEDSQASASALKGKLLSDFQFRTRWSSFPSALLFCFVHTNNFTLAHSAYC